MPIYLVSLWAWYKIVMSWFNLQEYALPDRIRRRLSDHSVLHLWTKEKSFKRYSSSLVGEIIGRLSKLPQGSRRAEMENIVDEIMKWRQIELEKNIALIGVLGSMAPLSGALGTVTGMITTFRVIGAYGTSNPALMADSISEALQTTQNGLIVAFPIMIIHMFLYNKMRKIEDTAMEIAESYIVYHSNPSRSIP